MTTKQVYAVIDKKYQDRLHTRNLCYNLRKVRNLPEVKVQIGRFEKITDPCHVSYIRTCFGAEAILEDFAGMLELAEKML